MHTYLDMVSQEKRTICALFPHVENIASSNAPKALNTIKQNKRNHNILLSEMFDAFWWCLYGMLYSTEEERLNSKPHDDYFYDEDAFQHDTEVIFKCEMVRTGINVHRYPVPKRGRNTSEKKIIKEFNDYSTFVNRCTMFMLNKDDSGMSEAMYSPEMYKMNVDMVRCSQERLIGENPDNVNDKRKKQFITIGNLLDDVFIHRGYVNKIEDEGAEFLTPEQVDEWESCKIRIRDICKDTTIPGFVRNMVKHPDFILRSID